VAGLAYEEGLRGENMGYMHARMPPFREAGWHGGSIDDKKPSVFGSSAGRGSCAINTGAV
jgi:hypothetical protein